MYFSTRILKPVFNGESRLVALFIVMAKIPLTIVPAFLIEASHPSSFVPLHSHPSPKCPLVRKIHPNENSGSVPDP